MCRMKPGFVSAACIGLGLASVCLSPSQAQNILFNFDNAQQYTPLPIQLTEGGVTATLSADPAYYNYSIQSANVLGFTPNGFSGLCVYPSTIYLCDLHVSFSTTINDFSILYAPEEYGCDSSATMRVTAYMDGQYVGTATKVAYPPGTWPSATLRITLAPPFNNVVVHYDSPPPTGGDWGPIFMADNMRVTPAGAQVFSLAMSGPCPGRMTASVTNATAGGLVGIVYSLRSGSTAVPGCPGVYVGLRSPVIAGSFHADQSGNGSLSGNVPPAGCGHVLIQAVDRTGCQVSNIVQP